MKIICSYCRLDLGEKEPFEDKSLSHSICPKCMDYQQIMMEGLSIEQYLDILEVPVVIINDESRVVGINNLAEKLIGKSHNETSGLLGGEAMNCVFAMLPEGCGNTVHCNTCTIRRAVMSVMESGIPKRHIPVNLSQESQELNMIISAEKIDGIIRMRIEKVEAEPKK